MATETNTKWGILYCPRDGFMKNPHKRWERIEKILRNRGVEFDFVQSERARSVERLVMMMINNGYKTIVIVGGDSALNDAINCLMLVEKRVRDSIALGVIPNGMMNDFAHFWNFNEHEIEKTIDSLITRRIRKIDLGCIRYKNSKNENCHRYFLNCVNVGLIAAIMNLRRQTHHIFGSRTLSFVFSFILLIFQRMEYLMDIKINTDKIRRKVMTVCVGNASGYGQTPNAVPYNGLLDVSVVYHPEMTQLMEGIYLFVKGKFLNHRSVHPYRTREVVFNTAQHALVGVDGRLMNGAPIGAFTITVEQEVINFIIP
ncbi:MAG: diacylglycerol/lipid kinase family protein [Prevotella sp.]